MELTDQTNLLPTNPRCLPGLTPIMSRSPISICLRVLITSNGSVMVLATEPATAPAVKFTRKLTNNVIDIRIEIHS